MPSSTKAPYKRIGEKIRIAREQANITQEEMSKMIGYSNHVPLSLLENGRKSPYRKLPEIARATRRPLSWFLEENKEMDALIWKARQYDILVAELQKLPSLRFPLHYSEMTTQEIGNELTRFGITEPDFQSLFKTWSKLNEEGKGKI